MTGVLQIFYPESEVTRAASGTIGILAFGAFKVILICIGVLLLLFGACALLVTGASALG